MSYILGIDTSSVEFGIGLVKDQTPVMSISRYLQNSHAEQISQTLDFVLKSTGITANDIDAVGISVGPGSFTGLRIGIGFLKGFLFGRDITVLPISTLESMAGALHAKAGTSLVAASDARNGDVFWARFSCKDNGIERLTEDIRVPKDVFTQALTDTDCIITDTLGYAKSTAFCSLQNRPNTFAAEKYPLQRGLSCAMIAARKTSATDMWRKSTDILPHYLNTTMAEKRLL